MRHPYTLWGWTSHWSRVTRPLRITSGSNRDCIVRRRQLLADYPDALTGIYATGDAPEGLAFQVQERLNPTDDTGTYDDPEEGCQGHVDDDYTLTSGAGIGDAITCDGSCNPKGT